MTSGLWNQTPRCDSSQCECAGRVVYSGTRGYQDDGFDTNPLDMSSTRTEVMVNLHHYWWVWSLRDEARGWLCLNFTDPSIDSDNDCFTAYYKLVVYR